ncbi:hypothetical protein [Halomonas daqiaonensis]|uniref:Uncharacterized protein n=1 Tax=Halomonas daqiaonensis TaxID=650850 RepID=A0A1H7IUI4_9GAMM|nr:hypothetical protein [Halomonas daqiaonensis]SEK66109.1 hypothetical protein SAMN04488129_103222 [Halomonas daqiaonensis]
MKRGIGWLTSGALVASLGLVSAQAQAQTDEVVEQIELGLELYQEEEYGAAITELEFAINDIRQLMSGRIAETFPEAPEGWSAGAVESAGGGGGAAAMFGAGGSMLEREYLQESGSGRLTAKLMIDNPMIQVMSAMFNNPAMIAAQPNMERIRIGRDSALLKWEPERGNAEVSFLMDGRILMQVNGQGLESQAPAVELLEAWDLDAVREQAAR